MKHKPYCARWQPKARQRASVQRIRVNHAGNRALKDKAKSVGHMFGDETGGIVILHRFKAERRDAREVVHLGVLRR